MSKQKRRTESRFIPLRLEELFRDKKRIILETVASAACSAGLGWLGFKWSSGHNLQHICAGIFAWLGFFTPIFLNTYFHIYSSEVLPRADKARMDEGYNELSRRLHATIGLVVSDGFFQYYNKFAAWRAKVMGGTAKKMLHRAYEQAGWTAFADAYLQDEAEKISEEYVLTNSRIYTNLYWNITTRLTGTKPAASAGRRAVEINRRVLRWHITGMLPEEFYNGLQIVNVSTESRPLFFSHRWEDYDKFYQVPDGDWEGVTVKRCTVVKEAGIRKSELSAFSTDEDLLGQSRLYIFEATESVNDDLCADCVGVIDRLLQRNIIPEHQCKIDLIDSILGRASYSYWPIVDPSSCKGDRTKCRAAREWKPLLEAYMLRYARSVDTSFHCTIGETQWEQINRNASLQACFKEGWAPEIVLFGDINEENWFFGYLGHYRPYTRDIELRFLTAEQTADLFRAFRYILLSPGDNPPRSLSNLPPPNHLPPGYDLGVLPCQP